ncbi:MAG TPA: hypothetical protein VMV90_12945 [Rectinemataceae bacterium]|nr:hypothetical protein [Rectinemataceae bacterium]
MKFERRNAAEVSEHRLDREAGRLVYPVISRRSGGLSVGVNLFPDLKTCNFDCPYCEVFPFPEARPFSLARFEAELGEFLDEGWAASWAPETVRDICISGNGEPSLSPLLEEAAALCAAARGREPELLGGARLVLITNSTGFLSERGRGLLGRVQDLGFEVWAKLDGGTQAAFERMSRSPYRLADVVEGLRVYAAKRPLVVQTMLCEVEGVPPGDGEMAAYARTIAELRRSGARLSSIQLYTLARPASGGECRALDDAEMLRLARILGLALESAFAEGPRLPIELFGSRGALRFDGGPAAEAQSAAAPESA